MNTTLNRKKIIVSVTNDITTDQRVHKVCITLVTWGFDVLLVGRKLPYSQKLETQLYKTRRFKLPFHKGALFYATYNIRLFIMLLTRRFDVLLANDLDTLLANFMASRLKDKPLVYDSHEYFTEVPELTDRPAVKKIWEQIEGFIFPKLKFLYTVNNSIANLYKNKYGKELLVVRNIPFHQPLVKNKTRENLGLPSDKKIIILQGAGINIDRGGEELVEAMQHLSQYFLVIVGSGDVITILQDKVAKMGLKERVMFKGRLPYQEMMQYTLNADLGVTLDKPTNINYRFSLPNKLFDYIHAGIAVLASDLVEVKKIVENHNVGLITSNYDPESIAGKIKEIFEDEELLNRCKANSKKAAGELTWENEAQVLKEIYHQFL